VTGIEVISAERQRQIEVEGFDAAHDDTHVNGEIADFACCYARAAVYNILGLYAPKVPLFQACPWPDGFKPSEDPIRNLAKAGALIAAEIDRLQRKRLKDK